MEKISALMDGELDARDSGQQLQRLQDDPELAQGWNTFHLIGDCLRNESDFSASAGFNQRLHDALEKEPTVLAPRPPVRKPPSSPFVRYTLPMAAAIAGVSVVAWLGLSSNVTAPGGGSQIVAGGTPREPVVVAEPVPNRPPVAQVVLQGNVSDYLAAHQEFSPRTAMQGVASYVRTVADDRQIQDK